ncbi:DUF2835 domain-containing protein [Pleionea sp. CnH1-48]|uniref:DUF2835 domain-containing protein n=1 Tax=Pleionea sp. CnH1-48 TaxID=2954494 RepID=UPI0020975385|nr:DUF2835 domain-containing protein [Pleionea sp. CnH1-48]MCO7222988.1 DUF2835 domain-containing protein [Pleionea sp. CnH1-48]
MASYIIDLNIPAHEWLRLYRGQATHLHCVARSGQSIRIAARHFQPHVTHNGINGVFRLETDQNHRFMSLNKISG